MAHRLLTVIEYYRILVLDQGKVTEFEKQVQNWYRLIFMTYGVNACYLQPVYIDQEMSTQNFIICLKARENLTSWYLWPDQSTN
jgi:hypothetical protein